MRPILGLLLIALVPSVAASQSGVRFGIAAGAFSPLTQLSAARPIGLGVDVAPEWRSRGGFGVSVGFRYIRYSEVPDHRALSIDARKYFRGGGAQPIVGLRLTGFVGGDTEGDDPFIGIGVGPVGGIEWAVGDRVALQVVGSVLAVQALYRNAQALAGLQIGMVIR
ncbi:MAG: hypothetical protein ACKVZ0_19455 [Gemmatimonadales bacterium]